MAVLAVLVVLVVLAGKVEEVDMVEKVDMVEEVVLVEEVEQVVLEKDIYVPLILLNLEFLVVLHSKEVQVKVVEQVPMDLKELKVNMVCLENQAHRDKVQKDVQGGGRL